MQQCKGVQTDTYWLRFAKCSGLLWYPRSDSIVCQILKRYTRIISLDKYWALYATLWERTKDCFGPQYEYRSSPPVSWFSELTSTQQSYAGCTTNYYNWSGCQPCAKYSWGIHLQKMGWQRPLHVISQACLLRIAPPCTHHACQNITSLRCQ